MIIRKFPSQYYHRSCQSVFISTAPNQLLQGKLLHGLPKLSSANQITLSGESGETNTDNQSINHITHSGGKFTLVYRYWKNVPFISS